MVQIHLDSNDDLLSAINKIKTTAEKKVTVHVTEDSVFSNILTLKLLKQEAEKQGKEINLCSDADNIRNIIEGLKGKSKGVSPLPEGFVKGADIAQQKGRTLRRLSFPSVSVKKIKESKVFITLFVGVIVVILGTFGVGVFYVSVPTATVNIVVKRDVLVKTLEVAASTDILEINEDERILPVSMVEVVERDSETTKVTGRDIVGERATGEVVIYNKTDDEKRFKEGTQISYGRTEGEDLIFLLDESVTVSEREASVSAVEVGQSTVTYTFGDETVSITAEKIGDEYNLKSGETFTIADFPTSSCIAQNDDDFSGGSSKEVEIVTNDDHERLVAILSARLKDTALERIKNENTKSDLTLEEKAVTVGETYREFDNQVGEEAEEVTLTMEVTATGYLYSQFNLEALLTAALNNFVPEQFDLSEQGREVSIEGVEIEEGQLTFLAKVRGSVIPKINTEKLKGDIAGKRVHVVESYLSSLSNISSYEIRILPRLPGPFGTLPRKKEKITINITHAE